MGMIDPGHPKVCGLPCLRKSEHSWKLQRWCRFNAYILQDHKGRNALCIFTYQPFLEAYQLRVEKQGTGMWQGKGIWIKK